MERGSDDDSSEPKDEEYDKKIIGLHKDLFLESNPIPAKFTLSLMGKVKPEFRLPLCSPSEENIKKQVALPYMSFGSDASSLTPEGERKALSVVRRHRLLETFLSQPLDLGREQLHDEAERLEHALSTDLEEAIATYLENPKRDPHGHPIPGPNGEFPTDSDILLGDSPLNQIITITQVPDHNPEILAWLENNEIFPGTQLEMVSKDPFDGGITVNLNDKTLQISPSVANVVHVSLESNL